MAGFRSTIYDNPAAGGNQGRLLNMATGWQGDLRQGSVSFYLPMQGANNSTSFPDLGLNNLTVTANGVAKIINSGTTPSRFGGGAAYFDGTNTWLTVSSNAAFGFGTGDFAIGIWSYQTDNTVTATLFDTRPSDTGTPLVFGISSSTNGAGVRTYDGTNIRTGGLVQLNRWNYLEWSRISGSNVIRLNGEQVYSFSGSFDAGSARTLTIGSNVNPGAERYVGYLSAVRVWKGVGRAAGSVPYWPFPRS